MNRREFLIVCAAASLGPGLAFAQGGAPRIGYLLLPPLSEPPSRERQAFLDGMREHGYVPGKNVDIVYKSAEGDPGFLDAMCEDLVRQKVDIIVVAGAAALLAARSATKTIPVVFLALGDPVGVGVVASLGRPGGNITGVSFISTELAAKRMEYLRDLVPAAKRIAFLWTQNNRNAEIETETAIAAARRLAMTPVPMPLRNQSDLAAALARLASRKPDAIYVAFGAGVIADNRTTIAEFGLRHRVPVISGWGFMTEGGGLLSYAPDIPSMFRRGAYYVDRILRGAKPADLPVEQAKTIEFLVNAKTAKAIGLALPRELLLRADRVIE